MSVAVIAAVLQTECNFTDGMTADEIIKETFKKGKNHWMAHNESEAFNAAVVVAYAKMQGDDKTRMKASIDGVKAMNAVLNGIPVDLEAVLAQQEGIKTFPLLPMWREI